MQRTAALGAILLSLALAACSSAPGSGSGFLSGEASDETSTVTKPVTNDPQTRVMQLAWNVARAGKCGFQLDAGKLRTSYLAWEAELGTGPAELASLASAYDRGGAVFRAKIQTDPVEEYCSKALLADIRGAVTQYVAGDFSARQLYKRPVIVVKEESQGATSYLKSLDQ